MSVRIIGPHPLANDEAGRPLCRIATVFPDQDVVVTLPGIHATQRLDFFEILRRERKLQGLPPLTRREEEQLSEGTGDIIRENNYLLIRPDPKNVSAALAADETLQRIVPKWRIRFLGTREAAVHNAIKRRGECWRTAPEPTSGEEMERLIAASRKGISGKAIYFHSRTTGTHLLTYEQYVRLGEADDETLRRHLFELQTYSQRSNRLGYPEVGFFGTTSPVEQKFHVHDFAAMSPKASRVAYLDFEDIFARSVPPELRQDQLANPAWRSQMYRELAAPREGPIPEETWLGLSPEFVMQIRWLPGGRIEGNDVIWDSVFEEAGTDQAPEIRDPLVTGFLLNTFRAHQDLEYVNFGRVLQPLSCRSDTLGRRGVYIAEIKREGNPKEFVKVIRMQKWGVVKRLDEDKDLLQAMFEAEEYTEYILDRRLACRQLGMRLPVHLNANKVSEIYMGKQARYRGVRIWNTYFEREYVRGMATNKLPACRFAEPAFALKFARLLGHAAAINMIVGRCDSFQRPLFDDGDEILLEDEDRMPAGIIVADHTGTFADFLTPLTAWADDYARPILRRADSVKELDTFADAYLDAFVDTLRDRQDNYRRRRRAFDSLFWPRPHKEAGSLSHRWEKVLQRLEQTESSELEEALRAAIAFQVA